MMSIDVCIFEIISLQKHQCLGPAKNRARFRTFPNIRARLARAQNNGRTGR